MSRGSTKQCQIADEVLRRAFALFECRSGGMLNDDVPLLLFSLDIPTVHGPVLEEALREVGLTHDDRITLAEARQLVHRFSVIPGSTEEAARVYDSLLQRRRRTTNHSAGGDPPDASAGAHDEDEEEVLTSEELRDFLKSVAGPSSSRCIDRAVQLCDREEKGFVRLVDWTAVIDCADQLSRPAVLPNSL